MRGVTIIGCVLLCWVASAPAQVSIGVAVPGLSIGFNLPSYPQFVQVPDSPVYYDPNLDANYFFYNGMYWLYQYDNWYASPWYNGPWQLVDPLAVPAYILQTPVRYYRRPPAYFGGWGYDAPPHWGERWGSNWEQRRGGWDQWGRGAAPARPPQFTNQRPYQENRNPQFEQRPELNGPNYRYQPNQPAVRQPYTGPERYNLPPSGQPGSPNAPRAQPLQRGGTAAPNKQQLPGSQGREESHQGGGATQEREGGKGQEQERGRDEHTQ